MKSWKDMFPNGRILFYEGNDPKGFAKEMLTKHGFDPSKDNTHWNAEHGYSFLCPAGLIDTVYGNDEYPLGS